MESTNFIMPPFARLNFIDNTTKQKWGKKISNASMMYYDLERETVRHGLRKVTTEHLTEQNFESRMREINRDGLVYLPLVRTGQYNGIAKGHPPVVEGQPWSFYGVVGDSIESVESFAHATDIDDHWTMGRLLGYGDCCIQMLYDYFIDNNYADFTWQQALNVDDSKLVIKEDKLIRFSDELNIISLTHLRSIGCSITPNHPCSFECPHCINVAEQWVSLAKDLKFDDKLQDMLDMLNLPFEWSALKGIAEIHTPVFKLTVNSVSCVEKHTIQKESSYYPEEAPYGLKFPWKKRGAGK
jgi:hypothetical protein